MGTWAGAPGQPHVEPVRRVAGMASLFEAPLSLEEAYDSARERRKRQKHKAKMKRRARREQRRGLGGDGESREEAEAQMASGFLAWRDQQEIEGPESWREAGSPGEPIELDAQSAGDAGAAVRAGWRPAGGVGDGARVAGSCEQTASELAGGRISVNLRVEAAAGGSGHLVHVTHFPFTIGRSRRCGFAIDDPKVSAEHCILFYQPGDGGAAFAIQDQSLSGVRVNGAWLPPNTRVPLADGCRISLGKKGRPHKDPLRATAWSMSWRATLSRQVTRTRHKMPWQRPASARSFCIHSQNIHGSLLAAASRAAYRSSSTTMHC